MKFEIDQLWKVTDDRGTIHPCRIILLENHGEGLTVKNIYTGHTFFAGIWNFIEPLVKRNWV